MSARWMACTDEANLADALLRLEEARSSSLTAAGCDQLLRTAREVDLSSIPDEFADVVREAIESVRPGIDDDGEPICGESPLEFLPRAKRGLSLAEVRIALGGPRYLHHDTTFGRLQSILEHGLLPDQAAVWRETHLQQHRESGVFFTDNFGKAEDWACTAFIRCRGIRDLAKRRAIVIRLPMEGVPVEMDRRAAAPGCLVARQAVEVSSAEWVLAGQGEAPRWRRLGD